MDPRRTGAGALALTAGIILAFVLLAGAAAARRPRLCIVACPTTTTSALTPASGSAVTVVSATPTSARLSASFDPGSYASDYQFQLLVNSAIDVSTPAVEVAAGSPASPVSAEIGQLEPNQLYSARLEWDGEGGLDYSPPITFTTPIEPAARPHLRVGSRTLEIGQTLDLYATAARNPLGSYVEVQDARAPYTRYQTGIVPGSGPVTGTISPGRVEDLSFSPNRNVRVRLRLPGTHIGSIGNTSTHLGQQPSTSNSVLVYVIPTGSLSVSRPDNTAVSRESIVFTVHSVPRNFRGEQVYFYRAATARGIGTLVGHAPLRYSVNDGDGRVQLAAHVDFNDPNAFYAQACVRHAILPDMGLPFTNRGCGDHTFKQ